MRARLEGASLCNENDLLIWQPNHVKGFGPFLLLTSALGFAEKRM